MMEIFGSVLVALITALLGPIALIWIKNKVKKPISSKTLLSALQDYYKNDANIAQEITKHILDNREEQIKETIRRKIDK